MYDYLHVSYKNLRLREVAAGLSIKSRGLSWSCLPVCSHSVVPNSCDPMDCSPPGSSVHWIFRQEYWSELPFPPPKLNLSTYNYLQPVTPYLVQLKAKQVFHIKPIHSILLRQTQWESSFWKEAKFIFLF